MADSQSSKLPPALWLSIRERVDAACRRGGELHEEGISIDVFNACADGRYESPIEAVFAAWWLALMPHCSGRDLYLTEQSPVEINGERYRVDFAIHMGAHPGCYGSGVYTDLPKIAIELDGHDFHERTKEQVTHRNRRDRVLQGAGWKVFHISGSELWREPEDCVTEVIKLVDQEFMGFWANYWTDLNKKRQEAAEREAANKADALTGS